MFSIASIPRAPLRELESNSLTFLNGCPAKQSDKCSGWEERCGGRLSGLRALPFLYLTLKNENLQTVLLPSSTSPHPETCALAWTPQGRSHLCLEECFFSPIKLRVQMEAKAETPVGSKLTHHLLDFPNCEMGP